VKKSQEQINRKLKKQKGKRKSEDKIPAINGVFLK
jgi:hypothetical protein